MAILHQATLSPSKLELLTTYVGNDRALTEHVGADLRQVGAYRFDDPAGQVGIESHVLTSDSGAFLHIPVVYRNEPLAGADGALVGTMQHSVLGERWVYDACIDRVYVGELMKTILSGGSEVAEIVETPDGQVQRDPSVNVRGSGVSGLVMPDLSELTVSRNGTESHINAGGLAVTVRHLLVGDDEVVASSLSGAWERGTRPMTLAMLA